MKKSEIVDVTSSPPKMYELWFIREPGDAPMLAYSHDQAEVLVLRARHRSNVTLVGTWVVRVADGVRIYPPPSMHVPWLPGAQRQNQAVPKRRAKRPSK